MASTSQVQPQLQPQQDGSMQVNGGDEYAQLAQPYHFPTHRLRQQQDPTKTPLILVVCGSFRYAAQLLRRKGVLADVFPC